MALGQILQGSYFSIESPLRLLDRWLNAYRHHRSVVLENKCLRVEWTDRANRALQTRSEPLIIEMQLYFSCVVKKRVLFHNSSELDVTDVNNSIKITFGALGNFSFCEYPISISVPLTKRAFRASILSVQFESVQRSQKANSEGE